ncbi:MAG: hypothetical protein ACI4LH_05395 [Candidatus Heritagella sp.]
MAYKNFRVAVYFDLDDMERIYDDAYMEKAFALIHDHIPFTKIYIETFRGGVFVDPDRIQRACDFFAGKGIQIAGGLMAFVAKPTDRLGCFCYSDEAERQKLADLVRRSAALFDEFILDDLFMFNCKCPRCQAAKGNLSWTEYRLKTMSDVYENLVMKPAREANPHIHFVLKYPNWYEQYHMAGYNLDAGPRFFDGIYAGTETRDPEITTQHLQAYQSYNIMRYLHHVYPGHMEGGWVDPMNPGTWDHYGHQFDLTLFAKTEEVTLWTFGFLVESFKVDGKETLFGMRSMIPGYSFDRIDTFYDKLGDPLGVASYRPSVSFGESYVHNFLGMVGVPVEMVPQYPENASTVFLTEHARYDSGLIPKIWGTLNRGGNVIMTAQLYRALQGKGAEDLVDIYCTDKKVSVDAFTCRDSWNKEPTAVSYSRRPVSFMQIESGLLDTEDLIQGISGKNRFPLLIGCKGMNGILYILNLPENPEDLYALPPDVLNTLRKIMGQDIPVRLKGRSMLSLFVYDNDTFIVQNFEKTSDEYTVVVNGTVQGLRDILTNETILPSRGGVDGTGAISWEVYTTLKEEQPVTEFTLCAKALKYQVFRILR